MKCRTFPGGSYLLTFLVALPFASFAQPGNPSMGVEVTARYSHAMESDLDAARGGGAVSVHSERLGVSSSTALSANTRLLLGAEWQRHELDLTGPRWLPETLQSVALPLGVSHRQNDRWRFLLNLQPRIAAAGSELDTQGFDLPVLALARYSTSAELSWSFGLRYSSRSDVKLLPLVGAVWQFAPKWEAALAFPESGVSYRPNSQWTLRAVGTFHGGDYRVDADPRAPALRGGVSLAEAWLEYREVRGGVVAEYALGTAVTLRADLGVVIDQRFDYIDRGVELKGSSPAYFGLSVVGRF